MNKRFLSLALTLALCMGLSAPALAAGRTFSDVPDGYWAAEAISRAVSDGVTNGYQDGTFKPDTPVAYTHGCAFFARKFYKAELDAYTKNNPGASWAEASQAVLNNAGVDPRRGKNASGNMTRYEMAQMMYLILKQRNATLPPNSDIGEAMKKIADYSSLEYYQQAILTCYALGLITGKSNGCFDGPSSMSRAQGCVILYRLADYLASNSTFVPSTSDMKDTSSGDTINHSEPVGEGKYDITRYTVPADKNKDGYITEQEVLDMLSEIKSTKYPEDYHYDAQHPYQLNTLLDGERHNGIECAKAAFMISDAIYGDLPARSYKSFDDIRPGDIIRGPAHWSVAISGVTYRPDYLYGVGVMTVDGGQAGIINWRSTPYGFNYGDEDTYVMYTRYPGNYTTTATPTPDIATRRAAAEENKREEEEQKAKGIYCANCGFTMEEPNSDFFDTNSVDGSFMVCDICHKWFLCGQCKSETLYRNHQATCKG